MTGKSVEAGPADAPPLRVQRRRGRRLLTVVGVMLALSLAGVGQQAAFAHEG